MRFLGVDILQSIVTFFQGIKDALPLEYLLYIFIGVELLTVIIFALVTYNVYELKLIRAVDRINAYLYNVQYIDDSNLIEFNNKMKRVPKTLRYHWQQYMLYREKQPSYYMSVENCIDRPLKSSAFASNIKVMKCVGLIYAILALLFSCGWAAGLDTVGPEFFVTVLAIPLMVLLLNYIFIIGLNIKKSSSTSDLYQTFHIFDRFIDKAATTLPEYVDFEVLFTRKEIKRGIPVLNEYIEKRQLQEQEEMRRARENAVQHELYNFDEAGEKGELVLERAMKETEIFISLKNRLNTEIEQLEKEIDSYKRAYENTTKDYQKKLQASKENVDRLREQQEATTNRIESNYIRKQQSDEIKKQQQIEKDQDDATLRYNQEINALSGEIKKRKDEIEGARTNVEKAMLSECETFSNKVFVEVRETINDNTKKEIKELKVTREEVAHELEEAFAKIEQLQKENKEMARKLGKKNVEEVAPVVEAVVVEKPEVIQPIEEAIVIEPVAETIEEVVDQPVEVRPVAKRGRPKKEQASQPAENKPAGKRGRPRKEEAVQAEKKSAGKRGRPRKEEAVQAEKKSAGKRGRPRKEETAEVEEKKPAGKRGRPKKIEVESEIKKPAGKRGRPKKEQPVELDTESNIDDNLKKIEKQLKEQNSLLKQQQAALEETIIKATKK